MSDMVFDFDSAIVEFVGLRIIGQEIYVSKAKKALLALFIINTIIIHNNKYNDYYMTIGDDNIFQELMAKENMLNNVLAQFTSRNYSEVGAILSKFLLTTSQKFVIHVEQSFASTKQ